jgi:hypothetical protein
MKQEQECCQEVSGGYLGTTCPKCNKPFRSVIQEPKQETLEEVAEKYVNGRCTGGIMERALLSAIEFGAKWQQERILDFLYEEITERRDYSASKMCEKVIEFIEQFKNK